MNEHILYSGHNQNFIAYCKIGTTGFLIRTTLGDIMSDCCRAGGGDSLCGTAVGDGEKRP